MSGQKVYSAKQVRELDRIAIEEYHISGYHLMRRAGEITFKQLLKQYPQTQSIQVVCGLGNNGGDGYIIATLAKQHKLKVTVLQLGDINRIRGDAYQAKQNYLNHDGVINTDFSNANDLFKQTDIIVDAIFGTGLSREPAGKWREIIETINHFMGKVVAVDIPSGLNANTGVAVGIAVKADLTVTYIGMKKGLLTGQARNYVGDLFFHDLDVPAEILKKVDTNIHITSENIIKHFLKPRQRASHKGHYGHGLVVGGNCGMPGAVRMAAEATLRTGAGLVSVITHAQHENFLNLNCPELMVHTDTTHSIFTTLLNKVNVIAIGPGLGQTDWSKSLFKTILKTKQCKVLDADALNLLAQNPQQANNWILTPHPGEAARLLNTTPAKIERDRYTAVQKLQQKYGGVCVLKGAGTLIATENHIKICPLGNPGMATAGMGDVLVGIITGLVAQHIPLKNAAELGVYLHAKVADLATQQHGERGLLATDVYPYLRTTINPSV